jgi:aminopeptidase
MRDERLEKLARVLVDYSVVAGEGEQVLLAGGAPAQPLIREIYARLLDVGAIPVPQVALPGLQELFFEHARDIHYEKTPPAMRAVYEGADAVISIMAPHNTKALANVDPRKQQALGKRDKAVQDMILEKDRWALTLFPTQALAQESEMSLEEYEEFVFEAMALNEDDPVRFWREKAGEQGRLIEHLEKAREVRIVGPETDLTLSIDGRRFLNGDGKHNMPCGEVFTGPVEDSANGEIYFGVPSAVAGREVSGVRFRFEEGRVVEASAEKGEEYLKAMLDADEGARYLGELGIGTNFGIPRATKNILFDEKLGGTVHLAIGRSYEKTGGKNDSSVHWDLICDLREGGELRADGEIVQKDGRFPDYDFAA